MTYAPRTFGPADDATRNMSWRYVSANHPLPKRHQAHPRNTSANDFQAPWQFRHPLIFVYYRQAPNWGRELSFREAVLPLMYRVREDGLQTAHAFATRFDAWHTDTATSQRGVPGKVPACRRAVYIGDNSNLLLELAEPTRAL